MAMTAISKHRPVNDLVVEFVDDHRSKVNGMFSEEGSAVETARVPTSSNTTRNNLIGPGTYDQTNGTIG